MKKVCQVMNPKVVTISPDKGIEHAIRLMDQHGVGSLLVVQNNVLKGILTSKDIRKHDRNRLTWDVMTPNPIVINENANIVEAIQVMENHCIEHLPVVDEERKLLGLITKKDILGLFGSFTDPLTGLPWGTLLKHMAKDLLLNGNDLVILFLDLDDFGLFNKRFGHVIGDKIIVCFSKMLKRVCDPEYDLPGRYAGDEFLVISKRNQEEAKKLAVKILNEPINIEGVPEVRVSIGIAGGRRKELRDTNSVEHMIDELLNLASRASTEAKSTRVKLVVA